MVGDQSEMPMTDLATNPDTEVEVDRELLEEAQRQISAISPNAAINEALRLLVDTSALVRLIRKQADPRWGEIAERGLFDISDGPLRVRPARRHRAGAHRQRPSTRWVS